MRGDGLRDIFDEWQVNRADKATANAAAQKAKVQKSASARLDAQAVKRQEERARQDAKDLAKRQKLGIVKTTPTESAGSGRRRRSLSGGSVCHGRVMMRGHHRRPSKSGYKRKLSCIHKKGMRGGDASAYVGQWYAPAVSNIQGLSEYTLERIDDAPMFRPLSTDSAIPTPTSGEIPTGAYLSATADLPNDTPPVATVASVQAELAGSGRRRRRSRSKSHKLSGGSVCRGRVMMRGHHRKPSKSGYKRKLSCVRKSKSPKMRGGSVCRGRVMMRGHHRSPSKSGYKRKLSCIHKK